MESIGNNQRGINNEDWACVPDKALELCKYFVLIITPGFNLSSEAIKEIRRAMKIVEAELVAIGFMDTLP